MSITWFLVFLNKWIDPHTYTKNEHHIIDPGAEKETKSNNKWYSPQKAGKKTNVSVRTSESAEHVVTKE